MDDRNPRGARIWVWGALLAGLVAALGISCQGASISKGSQGSSTLALSIASVSPAAPSAAGSSSTVAPMITSSSRTLTVTMTPLESGLSAPAPQTVPIPSASGSDIASLVQGASRVISVSFPDVEWGKYTVKAVAYDGSGTVQSQGSSTISVSRDADALSLFMLPPSVDATTIAGSLATVSKTLAAGASQCFTVPASMVSTGGSPPAKYYDLVNCSSSTSGASCVVLALSSDGSILMAGYVYDSIVVWLGGTSAWVGTSRVYVGPCPATSPTYLFVWNAGSSSTTFTATLRAKAP